MKHLQNELFTTEKNKKDMKKLLIFDCDGVLYNSEKANLSYFMTCLEKAGYNSLSEELIPKVAYLSIRQLASLLTDDVNEVDRIFQISQTIPYDPFISELEPYFDFEKELSLLKQKYYLAVATNRGVSLNKLFKAFNLFDYFHYKVSTLDAEPKPSPDMLQKCMKYFDVTVDESIFIGDAITDREAAESISMDFIMVGGNGRPILEVLEFFNELSFSNSI